MASICTLRLYTLSNLQLKSSIWHQGRQIPVLVFKNEVVLRQDKQKLSRVETSKKFISKAISGSTNLNDERTTGDDDDDVVVAAVTDDQNAIVVAPSYSFAKFQETITSLPPRVFALKGHVGNNVAIGVCILAALLIVGVRVLISKRSRPAAPGSVADLVRRGQLRSDRRGISKPLKYEDPFDNPFVKIGKDSSSVEMCGKVYRLAPVTLTSKEQAVHQRRRSRAYQWKRPTIFLKEGDSVPPDVDPDTVRWIPSNHPFATTASDIDEDLAHDNVYQKHGVPYRIQAEHEALQKKLEALQNDDKLNNLEIDSRHAREFQRPYKFPPKSDEATEQNSNNQVTNTEPPKHIPPNKPGGSLSTKANKPGGSLSTKETPKP